MGKVSKEEDSEESSKRSKFEFIGLEEEGGDLTGKEPWSQKFKSSVSCDIVQSLENLEGREREDKVFSSSKEGEDMKYVPNNFWGKKDE